MRRHLVRCRHYRAVPSAGSAPRGTTKNRFDVVVVGGGTAGLTSALAARHVSAEVALIERSTTCATPCKHERGQAEPDDVQSVEPDKGLDRPAPCGGEDVRGAGPTSD